MTVAGDHQAILGLLQRYFDGLYHADSGLLASVFHPDALYVNTVPGSYVAWSLPEYLNVIDQREPPSKTLKHRRDRVISIEITGPALALAKVEMSMMGRLYTDLLTLTRHNGNWAVIAKVFHFDP